MTDMPVRIDIINKSPHPLPAYATEGASGMDIRAASSSAAVNCVRGRGAAAPPGSKA
ncbi:MAG: hypothetical protein RL151_1448, partial [Bacteroidota bacterium]